MSGVDVMKTSKADQLCWENVRHGFWETPGDGNNTCPMCRWEIYAYPRYNVNANNSWRNAPREVIPERIYRLFSNSYAGPGDDVPPEVFLDRVYEIFWNSYRGAATEEPGEDLLQSTNTSRLEETVYEQLSASNSIVGQVFSATYHIVLCPEIGHLWLLYTLLEENRYRGSISIENLNWALQLRSRLLDDVQSYFPEQSLFAEAIPTNIILVRRWETAWPTHFSWTLGSDSQPYEELSQGSQVIGQDARQLVLQIRDPSNNGAYEICMASLWPSSETPEILLNLKDFDVENHRFNSGGFLSMVEEDIQADVAKVILHFSNDRVLTLIMRGGYRVQRSATGRV
ncbi:hypothetical protein K491DRAFT_717452 [Lophiostoma macrostomum CBS 122681]|uniref:Uncharacterized protein n=1 Tax=Lophiostoma macrostomum CBS 122681 TaxID=1314788 RepID=A0A6A6T559_9PLEO|nr:hypothetical protein K491DRAFT_717452 [Lophiostoma macrostomum CBS 122681]